MFSDKSRGGGSLTSGATGAEATASNGGADSRPAAQPKASLRKKAALVQRFQIPTSMY